jgi:hypothetical protein
VETDKEGCKICHISRRGKIESAFEQGASFNDLSVKFRLDWKQTRTHILYHIKTKRELDAIDKHLDRLEHLLEVSDDVATIKALSRQVTDTLSLKSKREEKEGTDSRVTGIMQDGELYSSNRDYASKCHRNDSEPSNEDGRGLSQSEHRMAFYFRGSLSISALSGPVVGTKKGFTAVHRDEAFKSFIEPAGSL